MQHLLHVDAGAASAHQPGLFLQMKNADYFSNYVTEDFTTYINRKRKNNCHGNHIEMQAMAEMYNRPVEVYQYGTGESRCPIKAGFVPCPVPSDPPLACFRANQHLPWDPPKQRRTNQSELPSQHPLQFRGQPEQGHHRRGTGTACLQTWGSYTRFTQPRTTRCVCVCVLGGVSHLC